MSGVIQQRVELVGVTPSELFDTYVDAKKHSAAIGAPVTVSARVGAKFRAFDGVVGSNLLVIPDRLIVQRWRAAVWKHSDVDSIVLLAFESTRRGAALELIQAPVPDAALEIIDEGWHRMYWSRWKAHFARRTRS